MDLKDISSLVAYVLIAFGASSMGLLIYHFNNNSANREIVSERRNRRKVETMSTPELRRKLRKPDEYVSMSTFSRIRRIIAWRENEFVPRTEITSESPELISRFGLFYAVQTALNNLSKDSLYSANEEELAYIRSACKTGDITKVAGAFGLVNAKNWLDEKDLPGRQMLRDLIIKVLPKDGYKPFTPEASEESKMQATHYQENRKRLFELIAAEAPQSELVPLERIESRRQGIVQLRHELASVVSKKKPKDMFSKSTKPEIRQAAVTNDINILFAAWINFLWFDYERKEISLLLDFTRLFEKKYADVISHIRSVGRKDGTIAKISIYLHHEQNN